MSEKQYYRLRKPIFATRESNDEDYAYAIADADGVLLIEKSDFEALFVPVDVEEIKTQIRDEFNNAIFAGRAASAQEECRALANRKAEHVLVLLGYTQDGEKTR